MIGIYKITNPKGKIYIGQSINIESRKRTYIFFKSYKNSIGPKIYNSLNKYGWEKHIFEIIEEYNLEQLNEKEIYWKQYYLNVVNNNWEQVLFCGLYDRGGGPKSDETKLKMSLGKTGTKGYPKGIKRPSSFGESIKSESRNKKIGEGNKGKKKPQTGIKLKGIPKTKQHKQNISNSSKGIKRNQIPIVQYSLDKKFIKEWDSITEANKYIKGDIKAASCGKQNTAGGYIWKRK
jgi:group I intron endonuclease